VLASYPWQLLPLVGLTFPSRCSLTRLDDRFGRPLLLAVLVTLPVLAVYPFLSRAFWT